jgi:RNA polymerase-binding transcription factor DksA
VAPIDRPDRAAAVVAERAAVADRVAALARQVDDLAEQQAHTTHDDEHDPEGVTIGYERAHLRALLASARQELDDLDRAAARLAAGRYGRCVRCGAAIAEERLDALPAVETCIACTTPRRRR